MALPIDIIKSLKSLPCFSNIQTISLLANGLSQTAIKVTADSRTIFAKNLHHSTANTEVACALLCAEPDSAEDSSQQLSPNVIYHDQQWLITDYISGSTLADSTTASAANISYALTLMAKLHQLPTTKMRGSIPTLDTNLSAERLLTKHAPLIAQNRLAVDNVTKSLTGTINHLASNSPSSNVLCHGDVNFSNILIDDCHKPWLIDFECAHWAPIEFDLAMFIAVNNIPSHKINDIVTDYIKLNSQYRCNRKLLNHYILYSFFINGLWYFDNSNYDDDQDKYSGKTHCLFHQRGVEQWSAFDNFVVEYSNNLPKLMPLIS